MTSGLVIAVTACSGAYSGNHNVAGKTIRYQVEYISSPVSQLANRAVTISYSTNEGKQEERMVVLPWTTVVGPVKAGFKPTIRAQFLGFGVISCRILADDKLVNQTVSQQDPYAVAECSA